MSIGHRLDRLRLPQTLEAQLLEFRRRVWTVKSLEAVCAAVFGIFAAYLVVFLLDRLLDTPAWLRLALFVAAAVGCANVFLALHRWVWRHRRLEQLARLLTKKHPQIGDQLLGIIELASNEFEQARSRTLCQAAIEQVATDASKRNFQDAVPSPRHRMWASLLAGGAALALALLVIVPGAATNAWARLMAPWAATPRYTFAALEPLPAEIVVPHGEAFTVSLKLTPTTLWQPGQGRAQLDAQRPVYARLQEGRYQFELPAQIDPGTLAIHIGDAVQHVHIRPMLRPELTSLMADVQLPAYLKRPETLQRDVRGGSITLVNGASARFSAKASRTLASAQIDGRPQTPTGAAIITPPIPINGGRKLELKWTDSFGLAGGQPFVLAINGKDDEAPSLACEDLPRQKVVLDSEQLTFKVTAQDDFGVKRIGIDWQGIDKTLVKSPAIGERILAAGGPDREMLEITGTFSAKALGIEPQPIHLRVFAEDYFPGRARVYSPTYTLYILTPEQHAIWLTEQLSKWHRQSLEVRDRELQLYETNQELRALSAQELDRPETRRRLENQSTAERANGRRLSALVGSGEELVRQAMRNPEFGVGHLEKWAEMLQILKDISANRMPSVADLLKQASAAPTLAMNEANGRRPSAGKAHSSGTTKTAPSEPKKATSPGAPAVVDQESAQQPLDKKESPASKSKKSGGGSLRLPQTLLPGAKPSDAPPPPPADDVEEAVAQQEDLLAEFDKIADELNKVLANLEASTLVKRLKAASRTQYKISGRINDQLTNSFGVIENRLAKQPAQVLDEMAEQEVKATKDVSFIMDDLQAYFERRSFLKFKAVLDDMRKLDVIGGLRQLGDDLKKENGVSIAQCEYWSDTLDRWAEDLVDPATSGACPGGKSRSSLPPSVVLEVLQILEGEVNLREDTRVTQQSKPALAFNDFKTQAVKLSKTQHGLKDRVDKVTDRIKALPDAENQFGFEIGLLGEVAMVMDEATEILAQPETGNPAIAAETEVIELILQSRRFRPKSGGGGGAMPGGGGTGSTLDSALALLGPGVNDKEVREDRGIAQATGESGATLPEEFRAGLDEYFNRLERGPQAR